MDQPIGCCHRHRFTHEDAAPRAERMVAGDDQTAALIAMGDRLEQHDHFRVVAFDMPEVIYRYHPIAIQFQQKLAQFEPCPRFSQLLQLLSGNIEPGPVALPYNPIHDSRRQMAFPRPLAPNSRTFSPASTQSVVSQSCRN